MGDNTKKKTLLQRITHEVKKFLYNEKLKQRLYTIIFESDTPAGKFFDIVLMFFIVLSILFIFAESMVSLNSIVKPYLRFFEYLFTAFFTIEYLLRLYCAPNAKRYALSFYGLVDLISTLPLYIGWIFGPSRYLSVIRAFRLIRVFRVFKLFSFLEEGEILLRSLKDSARKIIVFFLFVVVLVIALGTLMYMVEGDIDGTAFNNIPNSIYWAIVTLTTVGYGDITPATPIGRLISAFVMLLGYTVIAVPTGIVSASMIKETRTQHEELRCPHCGKVYKETSATYCPHCGMALPNNTIEARLNKK
ncbi:MAG: ion transporter [Bacteroidales bacterium]|nr:ion transporter [Bacteroidales bacterium]